MSYKSILLVSTFLLYLPFGIEGKKPLQSPTQDLLKQAEVAAHTGCYEHAYELLQAFLGQKEQGLRQPQDNSPNLKTKRASQLDYQLVYGLLSLVLLFLWKGEGNPRASTEPPATIKKSTAEKQSIQKQEKTSAFLDQAKTLILKYMEEESFGVSTLSQALHLSRSQLHRKVKAACNHSPSVFIRKIRLQEAKRLLEEKAGNISEVAIMVGMPNLAFFSRSFKSEFGYPPSQLWKENEPD